MALRNILTDNHPVLRTRAQKVKKINGAVLRLIDDMAETMKESRGAGLAANQVGISKRIILAVESLDEEEKIIELINPVCESKEGENTGLEGCLSIPGCYGEVSRAERVTVTAMDRAGKEFLLEAEGFLARILQHEMDHLDGILFTDKAIRILDPEELQSEEKV
ncbi:MAG: peptide deformylase [Bacillota bacterium]|nr:peptide deformylase [Bacillota bacterium]